MKYINNAIVLTKRLILEISTDHVGHSLMLSHLAWWLLSRFEHTGAINDLQRAIRASGEAVKGLAPMDPNGSAILTLQSLLFLKRFERFKRTYDLQNAISAIQKTIKTLPENHPDVAVLLIIRRMLLINRFNQPKPKAATLKPHQRTPTFVKEFRKSVLFVDRFDETGHREDLDQAIHHCGNAVATVPLDHPYRPTFLAAMALAQGHRGFLFDAKQDMKEGFQACEESLTVPQVHGWAVQALLLERRFLRFGDIQDLEKAVLASEQAAEAAPPGHLDRLLTLGVLGSVLTTRYEQFGDLNDVAKAIRALKEGLEATPMGDYDRPSRQKALSAALQTRYHLMRSEEDIENAIAASEEAVAATPAAHAALSGRLELLSACYLERFLNSGVAEDLGQAVDINERARRAIPAGGPVGPDVLQKLSMILKARFEHSGEQEDLTNSIQRSEQAAATIPLDHPLRAVVVAQLGQLFSLRFDQFGALNDLQKAIHASQESLATIPPLHISTGDLLHNHSVLLTTRFTRLGDEGDLLEAFTTMIYSYNLTPIAHPDRPISLNNMSLRFSSIYFQYGDMDCLQQATELLEEAIELAPGRHPVRPTLLINISYLFAAKFVCHGHINDSLSANRAIEEALDLTPLDSYRRGVRLLAMAKVYRLTDVGKSLKLCLDTWQCRTLSPALRIEAASLAAKLLVVDTKWAEAGSLLEAAIKEIPKVSSRLLCRDDQQYLLAKYSALAGDAMSIALQAGSSAWSALGLLELGRGIIMGYAIDCRGDLSELEAQNPTLFTKFSNLRIEIDSPLVPAVPYQPSDEDQRRRRVQAIEEIDETLASIRELPGFNEFQLTASSESLLTMSAEEGPIVIFNSTKVRSDALIVTRSGIKSLRLPKLVRSDVVDRMGKLARLVRGRHSTYPQRNQELFEILLWLWEVAVEPVFDDLHLGPVADGGLYPRVWWIGVGPLAVAPFHAAGDHSTLSSTRNTLSRAISSYIPTLKALSYARQKKLEFRSNPNSRLLIVTMPITADTTSVQESFSTPGTLIRRWSPLTNVAVEADRIMETVKDRGCTVARLNSPTATEVLEVLPDYHAIHFACHGVSEAKNPSNSHLLLRGDPGRITVQDISNRNIKNAQIAYLSACCTAHNSSVKLANESIHIASGFQLAGFSHVLGMLWPSSDVACCQVAVEFYRLLFDGDGGDGHQAVSAAYHCSVKKWRHENLSQPIKWATFIHTGA